MAHTNLTHDQEMAVESHTATYWKVFGALLVFTLMEYFYAKVMQASFSSLVIGLMTMAIVGGAIIPVIQGAIADSIGIHHAFILPVICYLYILFYALRGSTPNSERYADCLDVTKGSIGKCY